MLSIQACRAVLEAEGMTGLTDDQIEHARYVLAQVARTPAQGPVRNRGGPAAEAALASRDPVNDYVLPGGRHRLAASFYVLPATPLTMPEATKNTLIYTRVSTDEQAANGYSLRDQEARLREHCARTGRIVLAHFQDDASAKTFDRPEFKKMLGRIRQAPHEVDEVLVVKWDRFSRDMTGALAMIREMEDMGVEVQAAEQPIDFSIPEQQMMLAIYVAAPDVENRRRSLNTSMGTRRALREGRWCNAAPKGYRFERDDRNKPILVPNDDAPHIQMAYEMAAHTDLTLDEILIRLRKRGFRYGTSTFYELLRRPIYKGIIEIAAWRDEPAETVRGLHEPLVSAELWDKVQQVRFEAPCPSKPAKARGGVQAAYPLRGQLACPACSTTDSPSVVTASASRGNGGIYAYYHCHHCGAYRARASDVHEAVEGYLRQIQIHPALAALYREIAVDMSHETLAGREAARTRAKAEIETAEAKLLRADEMFFDGTLEADSYSRLKAKLKDEKDRAASRSNSPRRAGERPR